MAEANQPLKQVHHRLEASNASWGPIEKRNRERQSVRKQKGGHAWLSGPGTDKDVSRERQKRSKRDENSGEGSITWERGRKDSFELGQSRTLDTSREELGSARTQHPGKKSLKAEKDILVRRGHNRSPLISLEFRQGREKTKKIKRGPRQH